MFKAVVIASISLASLNLFAAQAPAPADPAPTCVDSQGKDITNDPDKFLSEIAKKTECYEATDLAEKCAYGSSMDSQTAGAAEEVCAKKMAANHPSQALSQLLKTMKDTCNSKYANMQGTMYISMNAYCQMDATKWIYNLTIDDAN